MEGRRYWTHDASVMVGTDKMNRQKRPYSGDAPDWETFNRLLAVLEARGFAITRDPGIEARHPILGRYHRVGRAETPHGALEFHAEAYPVGCKVEFFQDVVRSNPNGGRYDFDRVRRMPYLIRKKYEGARAAMLEHLESRGFRCTDKLRTPVAESTIGERLALTDGGGYRPSPTAVVWAARLHFNAGWNAEHERRTGRPRFARDLFGWPAARELATFYARGDADRRPIRQGETRWFRTPKGYLARGVVFGGISDRWTIVTGPGPSDWTVRSGYELFVFDPARHPRKAHPKPTPLEKVLALAIERQDFERAIILRDLIRRAAPELREAA